KALANRKKTLELKRNDRPIFVKNYLEILHRTTPRGALTKLEILLCNNELTPEVLDIKVPEEVEDPAYENWIQELLKPKSSLTKKTIDLENTLRELIRLQPQIIQISFDICSASILFNFSSPMKKQFENPIFMKFEKNDVFVDKREEEKHFKVEINEQTFGVIKEIKVFFEKFELVQKFFIHYGFSDFAVNDDLTEVSIDAGKVSIKINDHEIPINNFISALNDLGIQVTFKDKKLWIDVSLRKTNEIKTALDRDAIKLLNGKLYEGVKSPKKNDERTLPRSTSQFFKPEKNHGNTSHNGLARTTSFYLKQKNSETAEQKYESNTVLTAKSKRASRQISVPLPELIDKSISIEVADKVFYLNPNYLRTVQLETNPVIYIFMLRENEIRNSMKKDPMDVLINPFRKDLKPSSDIDLTKAMDHFSRKLCKPLIGSDREYKFKLTIVFEGKKISTTDVPYTFELCSSGKERVFCISLTTNHPQNPLIIPIYYSDKGLHDKNTISNIVSQGMTLDLTQYASLEPYN
ncbi:MAG: hypothetical protein JSS53_10465, partial [Proteobacteria bacterium]|nr:hypothetical protein [Pseudomonadota bacterium]